MSESESPWSEPWTQDSLVDVLAELYFSDADFSTVSQMRGYRHRLAKQPEAALREMLAEVVGAATTDDAAINAALAARYPDGTILNHNSPFHQWGGQPDDEEELEDE